MLLFFGVPSAYLAWRNPSFIARSALFAAVTSVPLAVIIDYVMETTRGWLLPTSIFGEFRLLGAVVVDQILWVFLWIFFIVMFYETLLEKHRAGKTVDPHLKTWALLLAAGSALFLGLYLSSPSTLAIDYFYLKLGILGAVLPTLVVIARLPTRAGPFFIAGAYFFALSFLYEMVALHLGQWFWPAENQFIGFVEMFGIRFPVEELLFWMMLGAVATLALYQQFAHHEKH